MFASRQTGISANRSMAPDIVDPGLRRNRTLLFHILGLGRSRSIKRVMERWPTRTLSGKLHFNDLRRHGVPPHRTLSRSARDHRTPMWDPRLRSITLRHFRNCCRFFDRFGREIAGSAKGSGTCPTSELSSLTTAARR
jgi:hypothetical protein